MPATIRQRPRRDKNDPPPRGLSGERHPLSRCQIFMKEILGSAFLLIFALCALAGPLAATLKRPYSAKL